MGRKGAAGAGAGGTRLPKGITARLEKGGAVEVELKRILPARTRPVANPTKLERMGEFDARLYTPIEVSAESMEVLEGMTRLEAARRAGYTHLPVILVRE